MRPDATTSLGSARSEVLDLREWLPGVTYARHAGAFTLTFDEPRQALGSAVLGGGRRTVRSLISARVSLAYDGRSPERDLRGAARELGLPGPTLGLMTAVPLDEAQLASAPIPGGTLAAIITVGVSNASRPGWPSPPGPGTINAVFVSSVRLREAAAVELVMLVTEAKAATLMESDLLTADGVHASGTSTDAVVVLWPGGGPIGIRHAGSATEIGLVAGRMMAAAIGSALAARTGSRRQ